MRDYAKGYPTFWTGETGKRLRGYPEAQVLAHYLFTCPHRHPMGLYYIAMPTICHETGLSHEGAMKALQRLSEEGFATYDPLSEVVWVPEMAVHQIGDSLKPNDNMVAWVNREYESLPSNRFLEAFYEKYAGSYHLKHKRGIKDPPKVLPTPSEANHIAITSHSNQKKELLSGSNKPDVAKDILTYLNSKTGHKYRPEKANLTLIQARLTSSTVEQIQSVIDAKVAEWKADPKMRQYLRPSTLFRASNFEQYLGQVNNGQPLTGSRPADRTAWEGLKPGKVKL